MGVPTLSQQTEAQFLRTVIGVAHVFGWRVNHVDAGRGRSGKWCTAVIGDPGFPDVFLVHRTEKRRALALELKKVGGRATKEQLEWIEDMRRAGIVAGVVCPTDWPWIEEQLRGER